MSLSHGEWLKTAAIGVCTNCFAQVPVRPILDARGLSAYTWWCFICTSTPASDEVTTSRPMLAAVSILLHTLKPPPKPRKPKQSKKISVEPMTPRKDRR